MREQRCRLTLVGTVRTGLAALFVLTAPAASHAAQATVAVAANFREVVDVLVPDFERRYPHTLAIAAGSTGKLYAQIKNGAPFDVFLAADQERPARLVQQGEAVPGSRFTYAVGVLALWSPDRTLIREASADLLTSPGIRHVAIANPTLAPYGVAARQTLDALRLWDAVSGRVVMGQNVGEAFAMAASGNAGAGFVALSSVLSPRNRQPGSHWEIPQSLHAPIRQDAVLLRRASANPAALAFLDFLRTTAAHAVMQRYGYRLE